MEVVAASAAAAEDKDHGVRTNATFDGCRN